VLPAYPALAILGGCWVSDALRSGRKILFWPSLVLLTAAAACRFVAVQLDPGYLPATRASVPWPEHTSMLALGWAGDPLPWFVGCTALLSLPAAWLLARRSSSLDAGTWAGGLLCALLLSGQAVDIAAVPRAFTHPADALGRALAERSYTDLHLVGFRQPARYDHRLEPIPAYYFSATEHVRLHSGNDSWRPSGSTSHHGPERSALILHRSATRSEAARSAIREHAGSDVWIYEPGTSRGFSRATEGDVSGVAPMADSTERILSLR
jgi:hypothetical protein